MKLGIYKEDLENQNPRRLMSILNEEGQLVTFYEHPTEGEDAPIVGCIEGTWFDTTFYDLEEFYTEGDYLPVKLSGGIIVPSFEVPVELTYLGGEYNEI